MEEGRVRGIIPDRTRTRHTSYLACVMPSNKAMPYIVVVYMLSDLDRAGGFVALLIVRRHDAVDRMTARQASPAAVIDRLALEDLGGSRFETLGKAGEGCLQLRSRISQSLLQTLLRLSCEDQ